MEPRLGKFLLSLAKKSNHRELALALATATIVGEDHTCYMVGPADQDGFCQIIVDTDGSAVKVHHSHIKPIGEKAIEFMMQKPDLAQR